jgi:2-polyprenyl-6-methoxyphenol hydroxylase-like FAD-dependent oxidoreductase
VVCALRAEGREMAGTDQLKTPVVIVGGGPVGLVLALLLDFYGVKSTIINTGPQERWHPKGNGQNARTMEIYRQLGFSDQVRNWGCRATTPSIRGISPASASTRFSAFPCRPAWSGWRCAATCR